MIGAHGGPKGPLCTCVCFLLIVRGTKYNAAGRPAGVYAGPWQGQRAGVWARAGAARALTETKPLLRAYN